MSPNDHPLPQTGHYYGQQAGQSPPTLADVAARAGVSRQTVSNAVNNPGLLRTDTLERVRAAIDELGYAPNRAARSLRTRSSRLLGLRVTPAQDGTANAAMDRFVHTLVAATAEHDLHVLLFADDDTEPLSAYEELLGSTAVDAFVVTDTYLGVAQTGWLKERRAPYVAYGRPWDRTFGEEIDHPWVDVDGAAGTEMATAHLLEMGHQRIAWLGWSHENFIGEDRRRGWERTMHTAGLSTDGLQRGAHDSLHDGRGAAADLLDQASPSAFVCASDTLAMAVFGVLAERGLRPGHDVAVVGYDDSQVAQVVPGGLTSVRPPLEDVAVEVVRALQGLLATPSVINPGVLLTPSLVVRGSTRP